MNPQQKQKLDTLQAKVAEELLEAIGSGHKRVYIHMATGSGKTNVATHFLFKHYINEGKRVMILSHNWFLVDQFLERMISLYDDFDFHEGTGFWAFEYNKGVKRLKEKGIDSYRDREFNLNELQVLFSTYQSMSRTVNGDKRDSFYKRLLKFKPDVVLIDEAHWGRNGTTEEAIFGYLEENFPKAIFLGLTATPRVRRSWHKVGNIYFSDLVEQGLLARPIPVNIQVDSNVRLRFDSTNTFINQREVYDDERRNICIVESTIRERSRHGKTIVFAGDTAHANALERLFRKRGLSVITIHSDDYDPSANLQEFIQGKYDIAVTVNMLSEGIDIPDIRTVVIARPVLSGIAFAQMVGRGARITEDKSEFILIDFHDATENPDHQEHLFHYKDYYNMKEKERTPRQPRPSQRPSRLHEHRSQFESKIETLIYDPKAEPIFFQSIHGLKIDSEQTFGIEFELSSPGTDLLSESKWMEKAKILHAFLVKLFGKDEVCSKPAFNQVKNVDYSLWNVVFDASCGFEIVTPILKGKKGFEQIVTFLSELRLSGILSEHGFEVNYHTGTHIHLGWKYRDPLKVRDMLKLVYKYEPAFHSLLSPSRIKSDYCLPVRKEFSLRKIESIDTLTAVKEHFGDHEDRYRSLNMTKFNKQNSTIEIRSHNGTLNEKKILTWMALWMNIVNSVERLKKDELDGVKASKELYPDLNEQDDIVYMCDKVFDLNSMNASMLSALHDRRIELMKSEQWRSIVTPDKSEILLGSWNKSFKSHPLIKQKKEWEYSNKFNEAIFPYSAHSEESRRAIAQKLIDINSLQISSGALMRSIGENFLLTGMDGKEVISAVGLKQSSNKFIKELKVALSLRSNLIDKTFDTDLLLSKFQKGLAVEKGWAFNKGSKLLFKRMNSILDDYFELIYPSKNGFIMFACHVEGNEDGVRFLKNGGLRPILKMKSPFSENKLVMYVKHI